MNSITLINPPSPWLISDRELLPLGILYLASYLRMKGHKVHIVDLTNGVYKTDYKLPSTDYYGISFVTPQIGYVKDIIKRIKHLRLTPTIIAGGIHATSLPKDTSNMGSDFVVTGEAEQTLELILKANLKIKDSEQIILQSKPLDNLNDLPFPSWDLIDMESYVKDLGVFSYLGSRHKNGREINIMATRGCNNHCRFCTMYKGSCRWRSVDNVIAEIKELQKLYGVNRIKFTDDNFTMNSNWLVEFCKKVKETGIDWACLGRTDQSDLEIYKLMKVSGCIGIDFGVESGSQRMLNVMNKNITVGTQERGLKLAKEAGLKVRAQIMIACPNEDDVSISETVAFIKKNKEYVDKWGVHTFVCFPSCEFYHKAGKYNYEINTDFSTYKTCGKQGIWEYVPPSFKDKIDIWRKKIEDAIGNNSIQNITKE